MISSTLVKMALFGVFLMAFGLNGRANTFSYEEEDQDPLKTKLDQRVELGVFGEVAYRSPLPTSNPTAKNLVLVHGIFGGASHRSWNELLPLLDSAGLKVFLVDLPGAGDSSTPKRGYHIEDIDNYLELFLSEVVREPAVVVTESLAGVSALEVSKARPDLIEKIIMISPTGFRTLEVGPVPAQIEFYNSLISDDLASLGFYRSLFSEASIIKYLTRSVFDDRLIDSTRINESKLLGQDPSRRWLTLSFVTGRIWRNYQDASNGVEVPVTVIMGLNGESAGGNDDAFERIDELRDVQPAFEYIGLNECGVSAQREKPRDVFANILKAIQP